MVLSFYEYISHRGQHIFSFLSQINLSAKRISQVCRFFFLAILPAQVDDSNFDDDFMSP